MTTHLHCYAHCFNQLCVFFFVQMNFSTTYCNVHDLLGRQQGPGVRRIPTIPYSYNIITGKEKSLLLINAVSNFQDKLLNSQKLQLFLFPIFIKIWYRLKELSWCLWQQQLLKLKISSLPCGVSLFLLPQFDVSGDLLLNKGKAAWNLLVNPLPPMNDQDRISPSNINTISTK